MSGKDLLALLVMIVPGFVLIALIALTLVPVSVMQPFPGSGLAPAESRKTPVRQPGVEKGPAQRVIVAHGAARTATQKKMRDPWEKLSYAKN